MKRRLMHDVEKLENVVFLCAGRPRGEELPQVETEDDVIIDLVSRECGKSRDLVDAEIHHQTED